MPTHTHTHTQTQTQTQTRRPNIRILRASIWCGLGPNIYDFFFYILGRTAVSNFSPELLKLWKWQNPDHFFDRFFLRVIIFWSPVYFAIFLNFPISRKKSSNWDFFLNKKSEIKKSEKKIPPISIFFIFYHFCLHPRGFRVLCSQVIFLLSPL